MNKYIVFIILIILAVLIYYLALGQQTMVFPDSVRFANVVVIERLGRDPVPSSANAGRIFFNSTTSSFKGDTGLRLIDFGLVGNQVGTWGIRGVNGANNVTTPTSKFDVDSDIVVLTNSIGEIRVVNNPRPIINDISVAGPIANGRDKASVFTSNGFFHLFYIYNPTSGALATISSETGTTYNGPTLPTGYTYWAYITSLKMQTTNIRPVVIKDQYVYYNQPEEIVGAGLATTPTVVNTLVPSTARNVIINGELISNNPAQTGGVIGCSIAYKSGTTYINISSRRSTGNDVSNSTQINIPNISQQILYNVSGTANGDPRCTLNVAGYEVPK